MSEAQDDPFIEQPGDREPDPKAAPAPEPEPDPEPDPEPEPEEEEAPAVAEAEGEEDDEPEPEQKPKWRNRALVKERERREKLEADLRAERERIAALEALVAKPDDEEGRSKVDREQLRKEALEEVRREEHLKSLNTRLDKLFDDGKKAFPKSWESRVKEAGEALRDEMVQRPDFFEAIADLDNATAVYHELTGDLDKMESLLQLPPHRMGIELAKISAKLSAPKPARQVSRAPAPITPLDKPTKEDLPLDDPNLSQEEFNRRMDMEEEKRAKARRY